MEDSIPSVEVIDEVSQQPIPQPVPQPATRLNTVNAVDTPDLFRRQEEYTPTTSKKNGRYVVPNQLFKGAKRKRRRRRSSSLNGEISTSTVAVAGVETPGSGVAQVAEVKRRRRRTASIEDEKTPGTAIDFLMIMLGASIAIPVAQLLIWWFVGVDPAGMAPRIGKIVPFVIPAELRKTEE